MLSQTTGRSSVDALQSRITCKASHSDNLIPGILHLKVASAFLCEGMPHTTPRPSIHIHDSGHERRHLLLQSIALFPTSAYLAPVCPLLPLRRINTATSTTATAAATATAADASAAAAPPAAPLAPPSHAPCCCCCCCQLLRRIPEESSRTRFGEFSLFGGVSLPTFQQYLEIPRPGRVLWLMSDASSACCELLVGECPGSTENSITFKNLAGICGHALRPLPSSWSVVQDAPPTGSLFPLWGGCAWGF